MAAKFLLFIAMLCFVANAEGFAQQADTITRPRAAAPVAGRVKDSIRLEIEARPRIAARRSAILPGLGQVYNGRWWKVPLVYGGFVGIGLVYEFNQRYYKIFLKEAQYRELNPGKSLNPEYAPYSTEGIILVKDAYRRNRDLTILAGLGFYAVQIIDAYVDAKFFRFDVSDELGLRIDPHVQPMHAQGPFGQPAAFGFKLRLSL